MEFEKIKVYVPLLMTKKNKPRKKQKPVVVGLNGHTVVMARGVEQIVSSWVIEICKHYGIMIYSNILGAEQGNDNS